MKGPRTAEEKREYQRKRRRSLGIPVRVFNGATSKPKKRDTLRLVVYVMEAEPYIKVGIAENVTSRLDAFKTHCPIPVRIAWHSAPMLRPVAREIEVACHTHLVEHHVHGEWFKTTAEKAITFLNTLAHGADKDVPIQLRLVV